MPSVEVFRNTAEVTTPVKGVYDVRENYRNSRPAIFLFSTNAPLPSSYQTAAPGAVREYIAEGSRSNAVDPTASTGPNMEHYGLGSGTTPAQPFAVTANYTRPSHSAQPEVTVARGVLTPLSTAFPNKES